MWQEQSVKVLQYNARKKYIETRSYNIRDKLEESEDFAAGSVGEDDALESLGKALAVGDIGEGVLIGKSPDVGEVHEYETAVCGFGEDDFVEMLESGRRSNERAATGFVGDVNVSKSIRHVH